MINSLWLYKLITMRSAGLSQQRNRGEEEDGKEAEWWPKSKRGDWRRRRTKMGEVRDWKIKDRNRTGKEECKRQEGDKIKRDGKRKTEQKIFPSVFLLSGSARARDGSVEEEMEKKDERGHEQRERWGLKWNRGERETGREDLSSLPWDRANLSQGYHDYLPQIAASTCLSVRTGPALLKLPWKGFFKASTQAKTQFVIADLEKKDLYIEMNNTFPH